MEVSTHPWLIIKSNDLKSSCCAVSSQLWDEVRRRDEINELTSMKSYYNSNKIGYSQWLEYFEKQNAELFSV